MTRSFAQADLSVARNLLEASIHRPRRGTRWIAAYRDGSGRQFWRSTGLTERHAALILAQEWERAARRAKTAATPPQPVAGKWHGSHKSGIGLSEKEIALLLGMSERGVRAVQRRAFHKLRRHPALRAIWGELIGEGVASDDDEVKLTDTEVAAVYDLARTGAERTVLNKLIALMST